MQQRLVYVEAGQTFFIQRMKALTGIDDHSRKCVCARSRERTRAVCDGLRAALAVYGAPQQILTENGKVFTGRFNHPPVEVR